MFFWFGCIYFGCNLGYQILHTSNANLKGLQDLSAKLYELFKFNNWTRRKTINPVDSDKRALHLKNITIAEGTEKTPHFSSSTTEVYIYKAAVMAPEPVTLRYRL